jgi:hypothetical protein
MSSSIFINDKLIKKNKVRFIHCKNWDDFTKKIKKVVPVAIEPDKPKEISDKIIFRGHALKEWKLSSRLERSFILPKNRSDKKGDSQKESIKKFSKDWYDQVQKAILNKFKFLSAGLAGIDFSNKSEDEIWAIGRHNGLITPLLDWTESPYIAAFFAFLEH